MQKQTSKANQISMDFLLQASDSNGGASMFEFTVPAGTKVPVTYYHEHLEETIFGLDRIITFTVEGIAIDSTPGETYFIPRSGVHDADKVKQANFINK